MNSVPNGNVTFLFTDIEGSTRLEQESHEMLEDVLQNHHSIVHEVIESNNGFVFKTIGDAFCCALENSADAIKAAVEVQIKLNSEKWNEAVIKVRMGINRGVAEWNGIDYMGYITLARTQRIMSAANGGQILISNDVLFNAGDKVQNEITFRDLGERRLKDLIQPMKLYQVISPDIPSDFPPLKTLDARPNNLPVQLTSFIGREAEMKQVKDLLNQTHLLTITGSGGAGKTRFAMQVAADVIDDFANGVWFIELAPLSEPALLPEAIMKVFGLKEEPKISLEDTLCDYIKDKEMLIILDNCEHLVEQCATLAEKLLSNSPKLKIIATSREALRCSGEQTHRILSLDTPDPKEELSLEKLSQYEAVRLFIERALAVNANFRVNNENAPALAQICYQLDGIPLAIELAAARIKVLQVEKINERLNDRFKLLTVGKRTALPRQQTLKALIDWSYDLLSEKEKILWRRLSVFSGGWTLLSADEICTDEKITSEEILDLLSALNEKSIIIYDMEKERYRILETLKQYGEEKLKEANDLEDVLTKHLNYFMELSETAEPKLSGSEVQIWLEKLESEHGNLQSAITWAIRDGDKEKGARLAGELVSFWEIRGHNSIGIRLLESILDNARNVSKSVNAKVLKSIGILARNLGEFERAQDSLRRSLKIYREMENKYGIVSSLNNLGIVASDQGNYEQAQKFHEESLLLGSEIGDKSGIADSLNNLGTIAYHQGNYEQAQKFYEESLKLRREIVYKQGIAMCLNNLGTLASRQENYEQSQQLYYESLTLGRELGDKIGIAMCLNNLGGLASNQGNNEQAQKFFEESLAIWRKLGDKLGIVMCLNNLGTLASRQLNYEQAQKLYEESLKLGHEIGDKIGIVQSLIGFSGLLSAGNHLSRSVILLGAVETAIKSIGLILQTNKLKFHEQIVNVLHEKFSNEEFEKYFEEGKKMTLEQAISMINVQ